jgi:hypothetical protein
MRIHIVLGAIGNVTATLPAGEFEMDVPGREERTSVQFTPLLVPGQRTAEVELPKELEDLDSPADRHVALADCDLQFGKATLLRRDSQGSTSVLRAEQPEQHLSSH